MYFNDIHILYYLIFTVLGIIAGQFISLCNSKLANNKQIFSSKFLKNMKFDYKLVIITTILYLLALYTIGIKETLIGNLLLIKTILLIPMLISVFIIDYKKRIIPNRLILTMFEIGLIITFIYGLNNPNIAIDMFLGMLLGGGVFLLISLIGGAIYGKEAMGMGDVKLMGTIGLYFGVTNIIVITALTFLIAVILSIILIILKIKKSNDSIPFGPFVIISCILVIFIPTQILIFVLLKLFTLGLYKV